MICTPCPARRALLLSALALLWIAAPRSADAGVARWTPMPGYESLQNVAVDLQPRDDGSLLLALHEFGSYSEGSSLFVSRDGGESWQPLLEPGTLKGYLSFVDVPARGRVVAGDPERVLQNQVGDLRYESDDRGRTWRQSSSEVRAIAVTPGQTDLWYGLAAPGIAGCPGPDPAVVRSRDAGATWEGVLCGVQAETVVPIPGAPGELLAFGLHSSKQIDVAAPLGPTRWSPGEGMPFTPISGGAEWVPYVYFTPLADGPSFLWGAPAGGETRLLRIAPGGPPYETVFAVTGEQVTAVAADPNQVGRLLLGTFSGRLYESADDGRSWQPFATVSNPNPATDPDAWVQDLVVTRQGRLAAIVGFRRTLVLSDDGGDTWRQPTSWPPIRVGTVDVGLSDPTPPGLWGLSGVRVGRSLDRGATWQPLDDGLPAVVSLPKLHSEGSSIMASVGTAQGIDTFRFDRPSERWTTLASVPLSDVADSAVVCPLDGVLLSGYCSLDHGRTWSRAVLDDPFHTQVSVSGRRFRLRFPVNLEDAYGIETRAADEQGWQVELPSVSIQHLVLHPTDGEQAMAVGVTGGRSWAWHRDAGGWRRGARLADCGPGSALFNPAHPEWLYLVERDCIQYSHDGGGSWQRLTVETPGSLTSKVIADRDDPRRLYYAGRRILLADAEPLRLGDDGRFEVTVAWAARGATGSGQPVPLSDDTGYFWFFDAGNVELVTKILDAGSIDQHYWVFYGALSNVEYEMTVYDTLAGTAAEYANPQGTLASRGDTGALPRPPDPASAATAPLGAAPGLQRVRSAAGVETPPLLVQDGRFAVRVEWEDFQGNAGVGTPESLTGDTGYFWFFNPANVELVVKVLDGRPVNGRWWVFAGALSNVAYEVTVTDTVTGETATYDNPSGTFASFADTAAFPRP